jgi:hypothetical protein
MDSQLILSETAYLTNRFLDSPWVSLLRSDVEAARAVIFAGYSLADLDIGRILIAVDRIRRKCVFIVGPKPSRTLSTTIEKFGAIAPIGVHAAAQGLDLATESHEPTPRRPEFSSFPPLGESRTPITSPTAKSTFDLYVKGEVDTPLLARSLSEPTPSYVVHRAEIDEVAKLLDHGAPVVIILSRLANGKTLLSERISATVRDRFDVFVFTKETLSLADEIRVLRAPEHPTLIVIDDYAKNIDLVRELRLGAGRNQYLLLTSRTPTHLTNRDRLQGILGEIQPTEFRVDTLRENELNALDSILSGAGLLGDTAG